MHVPVLLQEVIHFLNPIEGGVYVDATFGGGGYTRAILEGRKDTTVIAFDKDPDAIARGCKLKEQYGDRLQLVHDSFSRISQHIKHHVDGLVFDFGVSSFQLDEADRGFSFQKDGPLDMRMTKDGLSAAEVVNTYKEGDLADIIFNYGEEKKSRQIARAIVTRRKERLFSKTLDLASLIEGIVKRKYAIHPATKTFQSLRIFVNNELIEIRDALQNAMGVLRENSVLVGVTFHSLEDRLLKQFISRGNFLPLTTVISPSEQEVSANIRSRSAKLRAAKYLGVR